MEAIPTKPKKWYMTDFEIAQSYSQARNKDEQIHIIADMNIKSVTEICDKLDSLGFSTVSFRKRRIQPKQNAWKPGEAELAVRLRDVYQMPFAEIAKTLGKTVGSVKNKYQRMKGVYK